MNVVLGGAGEHHKEAHYTYFINKKFTILKHATKN